MEHIWGNAELNKSKEGRGIKRVARLFPSYFRVFFISSVIEEEDRVLKLDRTLVVN